MTTRCLLTLLALLAACRCELPARAQGLSPSGQSATETASPQTLERRIYECFVREDYTQAIGLITEHLDQTPNDPDMLYNLACAYCLTQRYDDSATALLRAFRAGYDDIEHLRCDPDLRGLREHPTFRRIMQEADKASSRAAKGAVQQWKDVYGADDYHYEYDARRRLNYAVALDEHSFASIRRMLEAQADQASESLFEGDAPGYDVLIAIPTPDDADKFFRGQDDIGGIYQHPARRLVARDIGGSLRHEFFHALHYAHMERIRQRHPLWIQEGLATLYEDYDIDANGTIRFTANDRQIVVKARAKAGRLTRWKDLFNLSAEAFMAQAQRNYPQVRSVFEFVAARGQLEAWYQAYVSSFDEDPTSAKAFEHVFGKPLEEIEREWRKWVLEQAVVDLRINEGDAAMGIRSAENLSNDGVLITDILPGSSAARSRLRKGDVIVSVDERATPSLIDLRKIIAGKNVGDTITLKARRNNEYLTMTIVLRPLVGGT